MAAFLFFYPKVGGKFIFFHTVVRNQNGRSSNTRKIKEITGYDRKKEICKTGHKRG